jgi:hypothetical protein
VGCSFSRELWFALFRRWGWENRVPAGDELGLADWWTTARRRLPKKREEGPGLYPRSDLLDDLVGEEHGNI